MTALSQRVAAARRAPNPQAHRVIYMAWCHPTRRAVPGGGRCRMCSQLAGTFGLDPAIVRRTINVEQRVAHSVPAECPKCGKSYTLIREGPWVRCAGQFTGCGWDAVLAADPIMPQGRKRHTRHPNRGRDARGR